MGYFYTHCIDGKAEAEGGYTTCQVNTTAPSGPRVQKDFPLLLHQAAVGAGTHAGAGAVQSEEGLRRPSSHDRSHSSCL